MTKFEEIAHLEYMIDLLGRLPPDITIGALYLHAQGERDLVKANIATKEWITHQWYKYTKRT